MSTYKELENSQLLIQLSEQEQEAMAGGLALQGFDYFFFQQTDIRSFADNQLNVSDAGLSSSQQTGYSFSQTTIAIGSPVFSQGGRCHRHASISLGSLFRLLQNWMH